MNVRMKRLRRFYMMCVQGTLYDTAFTYYTNNETSGTVSTDYYYGTKETVNVSPNLGGGTVTEISPTTFCLGELKIDNIDKPDTRTTITEIIFPEGIEKI